MNPLFYAVLASFNIAMAGVTLSSGKHDDVVFVGLWFQLFTGALAAFLYFERKL